MKFSKMKEFFGKLTGKAKKGLILGTVVLLAFAVILATFLNQKGEAPYVTLFSGLGEQEASEVMTRLAEMEIDYRYQPDGTVTVPTEKVDQTRATLAVAGYPKNGFAYETFLNNSNMMSTEGDKAFLKTGDMQDRLAAIIQLIDGVKTAVVQISSGQNQKYVLDDSGVTKPSASVTVIMKDGSSPTSQQVEGIQRLVAKSVANMEMGDVAVIDGNGLDVSVKRSDVDSVASDAKMAYEQKVEATVESNILKQLESIYGRNNVKVSVKCTADMQKSVSEENTYTAPNGQENSGYVSQQSLSSDTSGGTAAGGVPGAGTNANVPQYNTQTGGNQNYSSSTSDTNYALNQRKIQSQNEGASIADLTVAVSVNTADLGIDRNDLTTLIAKASGIDGAVQADKIAIVNSVWNSAVPQQSESTGELQTPDSTEVGGEAVSKNAYLPYIIGAGVAALLMIVMMIILLIRKSKKKARLAMEESAAQQLIRAERDAADEILSMKVQPISPEEERGREMKENIRNFAEENPEISAQLLKNWLRGGEDNG